MIGTHFVSKGQRQPGTFEKRTEFVDESASDLGLVFGWAIVCRENGEDYYDLNVDREGRYKGQRVPEHIPEDEMLKAALDFAENTDRPGNEMHRGPNVGQHVFVFPLTTEIATALGIETKKTGLLIAYKPPTGLRDKYARRELTGFSIQGHSSDDQEID